MSAGQPVPEGARLDPGGTGGGAYLSRVDFLGRNNNLNAVCLVAAAAMLWSHSWPLAGARGGDALTRILPGTTAGAIAVNVFFGLSGFLIARSYLGSRSVGSYVLSRVSRIYPALVVCVLLCMLLAATISTAPVDPAKYWAYFKYNASAVAMPYRLPGVFGDNPSATINGALWTLTFEIRMYLMCMAVGLVGLLARRDLLTAVVLLVLLGFLGSPTLMEVFLDGKANAVLCATAFLIGMVLCVNLVAGRRYDGAGAAGRVLGQILDQDAVLAHLGLLRACHRPHLRRLAGIGVVSLQRPVLRILSLRLSRAAGLRDAWSP